MSPVPRVPRSRLDDTSENWLRRLRADGADREEAFADLHRLLLRVAHARVRPWRRALPEAVQAELDDLCMQAAGDALLAVVTNLDNFAGRSRFTTWAIKFAMFEVATLVRRHVRHGGASLHLDEETWSRLPDTTTATAQRQAESRELFEALRLAVAEVLTARQREVFVAAAVQDVPVDILAKRLGSSPGAVYKTLHDARRKLRAALAESDWT